MLTALERNPLVKKPNLVVMAVVENFYYQFEQRYGSIEEMKEKTGCNGEGCWMCDDLDRIINDQCQKALREVGEYLERASIEDSEDGAPDSSGRSLLRDAVDTLREEGIYPNTDTCQCGDARRLWHRDW